MLKKEPYRESSGDTENDQNESPTYWKKVPKAKVLHSAPKEKETHTRLLPFVPGPPKQGTNKARVEPVRPARVRVGRVSWPSYHTLPEPEPKVVPKAKVRNAPAHVPHSAATTHLSRTELGSAKSRLKHATLPATRRAAPPPSKNGRELPYFLFRRWNSTGRGHARALSATSRGRRGSPWRVAFGTAFGLVLLGILASLTAAGAGAAWYINRLPPVTNPQYALTSQTTRIYDRNGVLLYDMIDNNTGMRRELNYSEISPLVISATVAVEDGSYWRNSGVDPVGIARAVMINTSGDGQSGASTITQQVVREVLLSPAERSQRSFTRKIKEAVLAVQMTRAYTKQDIMAMYLNQNYYGHRAYGIGAAALTYFGKKASDLTLSESALLAGLPQSPSQYDPTVNPDAAKRRQAIVLDLMAKQGVITQAQADQAKAETVVLRPYQPVLQAPHFVYYVIQQLEQKYGPDFSTDGLKVYTSLDIRVQQAAEQVAKDRVAELKQQNASNAAIVVMKPDTGEILAMVGSVDYNNTAIDGQVNVATADRQPGSSFKPITYVTAFEKGWTPGTVLLDATTAFPNPGQQPYIPHNYDHLEHGWVTVRQALANSFNIPAVKALQFAGVQNVIDTAHQMGIKGLNRGTDWYGLSLTLGGGEVKLLDMTNAYSTFANTGVEVDANPVLRIVDPQNRTIYQADPAAQAHRVLDPRLSYMITSILSDNNARSREFGLNSPLKLDRPAAAKTGTTENNRDSWTLGYTPNLTVGVWVGNSDNSQMSNVTGAIGAAVIWHNMMETFYSHPEFQYLVQHPNGKVLDHFIQPPGLITDTACSAKGAVTDLFLADNPPHGCTTYRDKNPRVRSTR